jgi:His/Glu/Gln/Arg/opine family amino acid ABC transporter permease subunit
MMGSFLQVFVQAPSLLAAGVLVTAVGSILAAVIAMTIAIPTAFARLSRVTLIRSMATFYVETIRGTPLLLQLIVWYYGVRLLLVYLFNFNIDTQVYNVLTALNSNSLFPLDTGVSSLFFAIFGLGFNYGAYVAEVIRAGIESVDPGQIEASHTLGLSSLQTARLIVLPQAMRIMIPPLTNNFVTLIQDTAFFQILGVTDLSLRTQALVVNNANPAIRWEWYVIELAIYFVLCYSLALASRRFEARTAHTLAGAH